MHDKNIDTLGTSSALNTLDKIPTPKNNAKDIVGLIKSSGKVTGYQLSDGSTLSKPDGVALAKDGGINGVGITDGEDGNNLSNLPSVSATFRE